MRQRAGATVAYRAAAFDIGVVLTVIIVAWWLCRFWLYAALGVPDNAPILLRPIGGFLAAWWLLRRRGLRWSGLGLCRPAIAWRAIAVLPLIYVLLMAMSRWLVPPLSAWLQVEDTPSFIAFVAGNLPATLLWIGIGAVVGGVCEELLFRGFLLDRFAIVLGGGGVARVVGTLLQALLFGSMHLYAGTFAGVHAALFALVMGAGYLLGGRNLWPLIIVHALWNAVSIWAVYAA